MPSSSFDFRSLNRFFTSQASDDLNRFLEKMPQNAGNAVLIAAGIMGIGCGLRSVCDDADQTTYRTQSRTADHRGSSADRSDSHDGRYFEEEFDALVTSLKAVYTGMTVTATGSMLTIQSRDTAQFPQFRELLGQVANGGLGWMGIDSFCVGRECAQNSSKRNSKFRRCPVEKPVAATE